MKQSETPSEAQTMAGTTFFHVEHGAYMLLGTLLAGTAALALVKAAVALVGSVVDFSGPDEILSVIDQLLFVFMLIEILHTVRASLRTGGLTCEPFLVVGLIASIRRVLVITLQTSEASKSGNWTQQTTSMLRYSMIELGVMGGLILAMVVSIYLLHRAKPQDKEPVGSSF
jgi:uncharacterized membrane protein (DUF373 family)